jgi:hypothetical protein
MNVVEHKNETVKFEIFILLAIPERFGNNIPTIVSVKKVIPFFNGKSEEINGRI